MLAVKWPRFAGESCLRHGRHADNVTAIGRQPVDLGGGLQTRALGNPVGRVAERVQAGHSCGSQETGAQRFRERRVELNVLEWFLGAIEKRVLTARGVIDQLMGQHYPARPCDWRYAANRVDANDGIRPEFPQ